MSIMKILENSLKNEIMSVSVTQVNSSKIAWNLNNNGGLQPK